MKILITILLSFLTFSFSAVNTLKYNGKTDTWTGKWQMSAVYNYAVKYSAWSGEETGYYVTKHNCKVTITVFAEENLVNNGVTVFKMTFNDCPYMDSAYVSAYDGETWIGDFHRTKAKETSYTNQSTLYFGIKMLKNITNLKFYPNVDNETYESVGLHCNDGYEPSKVSWQKDYYCLNSDSIAEATCLTKTNMVWINHNCEKIKSCKASEDYQSEFNTCLPKPNCNLHEEIVNDENGFYCAAIWKPTLAEWDNDHTNSYHCVVNAKRTYSGNCECDSGYYASNNNCTAEPKCSAHQYLQNHICQERFKPDNSHWFDDYRWACDNGYFQYGDECYVNCKENEYFETSTRSCFELPKKAIKNNTFSYSCPNDTHEEYNECVSDPIIDWSFIKNKSHLYYDLDVGMNSCHSKYYDTEMCFGTSLTLGYNFAIGVFNDNFQVGFNANSSIMLNFWETTVPNSYWDDGVVEFYNALTIDGGFYIKLFDVISYTGYLMLPLLDTDFDEGAVDIKGMFGNKISIDGEHVSIYFKYIYGDEFFNYKGIGFSYRF